MDTKFGINSPNPYSSDVNHGDNESVKSFKSFNRPSLYKTLSDQAYSDILGSERDKESRCNSILMDSHHELDKALHHPPVSTLSAEAIQKETVIRHGDKKEQLSSDHAANIKTNKTFTNQMRKQFDEYSDTLRKQNNEYKNNSDFTSNHGVEFETISNSQSTISKMMAGGAKMENIEIGKKRKPNKME
jgi:hypothetical protein